MGIEDSDHALPPLEGHHKKPEHVFKKIVKDAPEAVFALGGKRKATVSVFKGSLLVHIREYYEDQGVEKPSSKGIALSVDQWKKLAEQVKEISAAVDERNV